MIHVTCRLTAKNRNQLRNPTLGNRVWATFTVCCSPSALAFYSGVPAGRRCVHTCAKGEEEAQIWSGGQQSVDADRHAPVSLVDELAAEVVVDLAGNSHVRRRPSAAGRRR